MIGQVRKCRRLCLQGVRDLHPLLLKQALELANLYHFDTIEVNRASVALALTRALRDAIDNSDLKALNQG